MIRDMIQPLIKPLIRPLLSAIRRSFMTFNGSTSFGQLSTPIVHTGDFDFSFKSQGGVGTDGRISGRLSNFDDEVRLDSSNLSLFFNFAGGVGRTIAFDSAIDRNKLNSFSLKRRGSTVTLDVNGDTQADTETHTGTFTTEVYGAASNTFNGGVLSDIQHIDDPLGTPVTQTFPMNTPEPPSGSHIESNLEDTNTIEFTDVETEVFTLDFVTGDFDGVELWSNPAANIGAGWSFDGGTQYSLSILSGGSEINNSVSGLVAGGTYEVSINQISNNGTLKAAVGGGSDVNFPTGLGKQTVIVIAGATGIIRIRTNVAIMDAVIDSITFKRILEAP